MFAESIKINFMYFYTQHIKRNLVKKKAKDIEKFSQRKDYH